MEAISIFVVAGLVFFLCWLVDRAFTKLFRSKAQQRSGMAVRANKRYGVFGVILSVLGILGIVAGTTNEKLFTYAGIIVLLMGLGLAVHYLSFGIFMTATAFWCAASGANPRSIASGRL